MAGKPIENARGRAPSFAAAERTSVESTPPERKTPTSTSATSWRRTAVRQGLFGFLDPDRVGRPRVLVERRLAPDDLVFASVSPPANRRARSHLSDIQDPGAGGGT